MLLFSVNDTVVLCNARHSEVREILRHLYMDIAFHVVGPSEDLPHTIFCEASLPDALKIEDFVLVLHRSGHTCSHSEHSS